MPRSCKTCKFLVVKLDSTGRRRVINDSAYPCEKSSKEHMDRYARAIPESVKVALSPRYMSPINGTTCTGYAEYIRKN